jgi:hypothetical protein
MILVYFGIGSGQFLLNVNDVQGKSIFMLAGILFALCLIPISATRAVKPQPFRVPRYNLIKLFQLASFSMVGTFVAGLINSSFYSPGPMLGLEIGLPVYQISWFMSITVWSSFPMAYRTVTRSPQPTYGLIGSGISGHAREYQYCKIRRFRSGYLIVPDILFRRGVHHLPGSHGTRPGQH